MLHLFLAGSAYFTCVLMKFLPPDRYGPDNDQVATNEIPCEKKERKLISSLLIVVILDTARKSSAYFLFSFILMLNGEFFCFTGFLKTSKKIFSFISGVCFIIAGNIPWIIHTAADLFSGLVILTGIINYISIFKAEVGNKLYARFEH